MTTPGLPLWHLSPARFAALLWKLNYPRMQKPTAAFWSIKCALWTSARATPPLSNNAPKRFGRKSRRSPNCCLLKCLQLLAIVFCFLHRRIHLLALPLTVGLPAAFDFPGGTAIGRAARDHGGGRTGAGKWLVFRDRKSVV